MHTLYLYVHIGSCVKATVKEVMVDLSTYHILIYPLLECLHCLTRYLPNSPLGKTVGVFVFVCVRVHMTKKYFLNFTGRV